MRIIASIITSFNLFLNSALVVLAHETEQPHVEQPATISPLVAVGFIAIVALGGFILWKFVLKPKEPPVQKKTEAVPAHPDSPTVVPPPGDNKTG